MAETSPLKSSSETSEEYEQEEDDEDEDDDPIASVLHRLATSPVPIKVHSVQIKTGSKTNQSLVESELDLSSITKATTVQELVYAAGLANARLKRLGVFESVRITIDAGPEDVPGSSIVVVEVKESAWPVSGDFALDSNPEEKEWALGTCLKLKNLLGFGDIFDVSTSYGSYRPTELGFGLSLPRFKSVPTPLMARISFSPRDLFSLSSYKNPLTGLSLGLISTLNHTLQYDLTIRSLIRDPLRKKPHRSVKDWMENGVLNSVKYSYKIDERDSSTRPKSGYAFLSSSQIGGFWPNNLGSRFFRQEFDLRGAIPLGFLNSSLNLGLSAGLIFPSGKKITELPPQKPYSFNFTNTSPSSKLGGLSLFSSNPKMENSISDSNGGNLAVSAFADVAFDFPSSEILKRNGVYFHAFVNAGNVGKLKGFEWGGFKGVLEGSRSSAGFGMILPTKLFRLEINYCYILKKFEHDKGKNGIQFNFSSP
ncbi:hypothetical protein LUZ60_015369 [Juncus effusus]|nr:hypothetical protein LUZ60_015369 [Juncus effusus]